MLDWRGVIVRGMRERVLAMVSWREISKVEIRERNGEESHRERGSGTVGEKYGAVSEK